MVVNVSTFCSLECNFFELLLPSDVGKNEGDFYTPVLTVAHAEAWTRFQFSAMFAADVPGEDDFSSGLSYVLR